MGRIGISCLLCMAIAAGTPVEASELRTVALSDYWVRPPDVRSVNYTRPLLNDAGRTLFQHTLYGNGVNYDNNDIVWTELDTDFGLGLLSVVRDNQVAPGSGGKVFMDLAGSGPVRAFSALGQVVLYSYLADPAENYIATDRAIYLWTREKGLESVARKSGPTPGGGPDSRFVELLFNSLGDDGTLAFSGWVTDGANSYYANWLWKQNQVELLARDGDPAPGTSAVFHGVGSVRQNRAGGLVFSGGLVGPDVTSANDGGIWARDASGNVRLVVREGDLAPEAGANVRFRSTADIGLSDAGLVAIRGQLTGNGIDFDNDLGYWSETRGGGLRLIAREGSPAPGTEVGTYFRSLRDYSHNARGEIAFAALLGGNAIGNDNFSGIWVDRQGSGLKVLIRSGEHAPGTEPDTVFDGISLNSPVLNDSGQVAFLAKLMGPTIDITNGLGIWAQDRGGVLKLIARTGDMLEVAPGDFRIIDYLEFADGTSMSATAGSGNSGFNNIGQVAFSARFTDGSSGVFVSDLAAIPEPVGWAMFAVGVVLLHPVWPRRWRAA